MDKIFAAISRLRVLVVGDICLDRWCTYDPETAEPSRETGIPRIGVVETVVSPGAAGTVASNLAALGVRETAVLGVVGDDGFGFELQGALHSRSISADLVIRSEIVPTFTYTKLINGATGVEDLPRVDFIYTKPFPSGVEKQLIRRLDECWKRFDVVLVSDQAETEEGGSITPLVRETLGTLAASQPDKVVWVDSRIRGERFRNILLKCNVDEAVAACHRAFGKVDFEALQGAIGSRPLVVTMGAEGAMAITGGGRKLVPTRSVPTPVDICGAGDSFSAGAALALAITGDAGKAVSFGNIVASVTIMKKGTGTASPIEVFAASRNWPQ